MNNDITNCGKQINMCEKPIYLY